MKKYLLMISVALAASFTGAQAQDVFHAKQSAEVDILWPVFPGAFRGHFLFNLWQKGHWRGDIYFGLNVDFPQNRDTEGRFADYSIASGYRQYIWRGLHIEFSQTTGLGVLQDHVSTGRTYESFDWLMSGYAGYKFNLARKKLYVLPQLGMAGVVYKSNPWPIYEDNTLTVEAGEKPFFVGAVRLGINIQ